MKNIYLLFTLTIAMVSVQPTHAQVPGYVPTSGLLAWYSFNGNANNSYGSGNNGVPYGTVTYGTDRFGYAGSCYVGNGASGIDLPGNNFPSGNATRSMSAWFKGVVPYPGSFGEIIATGSNASIGSRFGCDLESASVGFESTGFGKRVSLTIDSCWHNITITYPTGGTGMSSVKVYLDGSLASTYYISSMPTLNSDTGYVHAIGALFLPPYNPYTPGAFLYSFHGSLDDIGVWNRELTATEVANLYYASAAISGATPLCVGGTETLTDTALGGTWTSSNTAIATVGSTGIVAGIGAGTVTISYTLGGTTCPLVSTTTISVSVTSGTITGTAAICSGSTTTLSDTAVGGTWSSSNSTVATVGSSSGIVTGLTVGVATYDTITYTLLSGCKSTKTITVNPLPTLFTVTGGGSYCAGGTGVNICLSGSQTGVNYQLFNGTSMVGIPVAGTGASICFGLHTAVGTYTVVATNTSTGCSRTMTGSATIIINPLPIAYPVYFGTPGIDSICSNSTGNHIILGGSDFGIIYQLFCNGIPVGSPVAGFGTMIDFGPFTTPGIYTITATNSITSCINLMGPVTIMRSPGPITGLDTLCSGAISILSDTTLGGVWTSSNTTIVHIGSGSGIDTAGAGGYDTIIYTLSDGCSVSRRITVDTLMWEYYAPAICVGGTDSVYMRSGIPHGTWSCSPPGIITIGSVSGVVTGISAGIVAITFTSTLGCMASFPVSVNATPPPISGLGNLCQGFTTTMIDPTPLGTWSTTNGNATVNPTTGLVTGITPGVDTIAYTLGTGCSATKTITVEVSPGPITGTRSLCVGSCSILACTLGGAWYSSGIIVASVGSTTGMVCGISTGTTTISYILADGCYSTISETVNPSPGPIGGASTVCVGSATTLTDTSHSGTWGASNGHATVSTSGVVTGITAGVDTISYTFATGCTATKIITVNSLPTISAGPGVSICSGTSTALTATGSTTYTWSPPTWLSTTTGATVIASPTSTITYTVTGTTAGCSNTASVTVTVGAALTVSAGPGITICPGSSTTMTATGATTYTWSPSTGLSATTGTTVTASPATTTTYAIVGTTGACSGFATKTVTIGSALTISAGAGVTICSGTSTPVTATGGTTYTWSPSTGLSATTGATVTASPATTTTYTIVGTTGTCTGTTTKTVSVNATPTISAGTGIAICSGSSATLSATGGTTYSWSPATGLSTTTGASVTANPTTTTTYTITGTTAGCTGTATKTVTVNAVPVISAGSGVTICPGSSTSITATGGTTYTWTPSIGLSATTGATVSASPSTTTTYTITGTTAGCTGTTTKTVTVGASLTISAGPGIALCSGSSATLTATGGTTYTWSPSTGLSATTGTSVTASPATTTTYTITGTTGGCSGTGTKTVTVNAVPAISAGAGITICNGSSTTLTASGGTTYTWSPGTGLSTTTGASITASPTSTTTYTVTGTVAGCSAAATETITVTTGPTVSAGPGVTICAGSTTPMIATGATSYTWSPSAGLSSSTGATVIAAPMTTTTYTVTGSMIGCSGTATKTVTINTSAGVISGSTTMCQGSTTTLSETMSGGTWTSSNPIVATVGSATGTVNAILSGAITITYTSGSGCRASWPMAINPLPSAITGGSTLLCAGSTMPLRDATPAGTWSSSNTSIATVSTSGVVTGGTTAGAVTISYTLISGCAATRTITVNALPPISGVSNLCAWSDTITVHDLITTGLYSSRLVTVVNVGGGTGIVAAAAAGIAHITYTLPSGCSTTATLTVNPIPGLITGANHIPVGGTTTLSNSVPGGTWSSGAPGIATANSTTGMVTGIAVGIAHITYTLPTGCFADTVVHVAVARPGMQPAGAVSGADADIQVVPNPNKGVFTISGTISNAKDEENVFAELTNMLGQVVFRTKLITHNGRLEEEISTGDIANGMYLLNLQWSNGKKVTHLVVSR